ncbi:hypothetical protein L228DRAFT_246306 [Xylona heveae TC161]|uniref:Uncharacterized protein n=1 Tax=Xylona heveae (strain CBS 132557 / TC161) TaxID=1328760 RepID=A0A165HHM5_XYLHT|nr:hypothetical protein L228DRAFT_246306 [Xylona heveae TC161]KZF23532.1 hypothetical protein L228DRAFT_246306 [Xylona heveae TC161]
MAHTTVALLGTCDTKLEELLYLRSEILRSQNLRVILIDVGNKSCEHSAINISHGDLISRYSTSAEAGFTKKPEDNTRADMVRLISTCASSCVRELFHSSSISGIISIGGSSGTSLVATVMRDSLPIGFPKLIVSTMASGDISTFVGETDISMMYSVVDIAGSNSILHKILSNAAGAITGMSLSYQAHKEGNNTGVKEKKKVRVGVTMFGVTTPCVDEIRRHLEAHHGYEVYVFHATGAGGRAMERLVRENLLDAILDLTTSEIPDEIVGGVLTAGPNRLEAAAKAGIPQVVSVGACDMVNFGPRGSLPQRFAHRNIYEHNPSVTLVRTSEDECRKIGAFISEKLRENVKSPQLVQVWLPTGGISMIESPGGPYHDSAADEALFTAIEKGLEESGIGVKRDQRYINDPSFAVDIAEQLVEFVKRSEGRQ